MQLSRRADKGKTMKMQKLTAEQIIRPVLAAVFILIYWMHNDPEPVGTRAFETTSTVTRHYTLPCYIDVRAAHPEVPSGKNVEAYFEWYNNPTNRNDRDDYLSDIRDCENAHNSKFGKWNFESMILVRVTNN